jgi:hypothetical protein
MIFQANMQALTFYDRSNPSLHILVHILLWVKCKLHAYIHGLTFFVTKVILQIFHALERIRPKNVIS